MPQTLKDAVIVTRKLGLRFLWIDSLCIMQDSAADKHSQISAMGSVYKNATITIAASISKDVQSGFLGSRDQRPTITVPVFLSDKTLGLMHLAVARPPTWSDEPLDKRAWALQEALLAPRMVSYNTDEIVWHCQKHQFRRINNSHICYLQNARRLPAQIFAGVKSPQQTSTSSQQQLWLTIVQDYSRRSLSFREDQLPALAGVATELNSMWKDSYYAGMWGRCLVQHLGWYRATSVYPLDGATPPSWSWTATFGPVWIKSVNAPSAQVLDCSVDLRWRSVPFGPVDEGRLVLIANVLFTKRVQFNQDYTRCTLGRVIFDFSPDNQDHERFCYAQLGQGTPGNQQSIVALILRKDRNSYKRVGIILNGHIEEWEGSERLTLTIV